MASTVTLASPVLASPESGLDNQDAVAVIDAAIDAFEDGDDDELERLLDFADDGGVWMPDAALAAFLSGDQEEIVFQRDLLDTDDGDLLLEASRFVDSERRALDAIPPEGTSDPDVIDEIDVSDRDGATALQIIDYRGLAISDDARRALAPFAATAGAAPDADVYLRAIADLDPDAPFAVPAEAVVDDGPDNVDVTVSSEQPPAEQPATEQPATEQPATEQPAAEAVPSPAAPVEPAAEQASTSPILLLLVAVAVGIAALALYLVTSRGRRHDRLADIAFTDGLTGLMNRRRLDADVTERAHHAQPTAALMVDVDHFKRFNDTHGHSMGDEVLRLVGAVLTREFRKTDVPYRYGGEEFCVLLPDTTQAEAEAAGERLRAAIERIELPIPDRITASIGVSIGPASAISDTIERADAALYNAKELGRNRVASA